MTSTTEEADVKPIWSHDDAPRRRHHLRLEIGADDLEDLLSTLQEIKDTLERDRSRTRTWISGGYSRGFIVDLREDPEMTHDRFVGDLQAFLATKALQAPSRRDGRR